MLNMLVLGKYLPYTHSHMTPTVKGGTVKTAVGAEGGVGETGLGRQKTEKGKEEQKDQLGSSPTEMKATAEKKCHSI